MKIKSESFYLCKCDVKSCVNPYKQMTHPFVAVAATSATYSRKTRIEKVSLPRSTHTNLT